MGRVLITGGLGLVGCSYAAHCIKRGDDVFILDNYARGSSSELNAKWLLAMTPRPVILKGSVSNYQDVLNILASAKWVDAVVHAAAQSSVNVSMTNPSLDFQSNVIGTFNLLEGLRTECPQACMVFIASNKVYDTTAWPVERVGSRYQWIGKSVGPSDAFPFHTDAREPYGASKISGLYYSRCYATMYNMPIVCMVPSGMYGRRQYGKTEQGWMGHFAIATELGLPITIYGDGFQSRDMCYTDDVCSALDLLLYLAPGHKGEVFNLGGGPENAVSLVDALEIIWRKLGKSTILKYVDWRPMDNRVYTSNIDKLKSYGWVPQVTLDDGIGRLCKWVHEDREDLQTIYA